MIIILMSNQFMIKKSVSLRYIPFESMSLGYIPFESTYDTNHQIPFEVNGKAFTAYWSLGML